MKNILSSILRSFRFASSRGTVVTEKNVVEQTQINTDDIEKILEYYTKQQLENALLKDKVESIDSTQKIMQIEIDELKSFHEDEQPIEEFKIYGFGKHTTGGEDGEVIRVTNLNDSGSGSFRDAVLRSGKRIIKIEVEGVLNLGSNIYVTQGDLTILGQFAPGEGLTITGGMVQFENSNVIVRYMRFRKPQRDGTDCVSITAWQGKLVENVVFDHCSFSEAEDENFDIRGVNGGIVRNVTVQNCIISNNTYGLLSGTGTYNVSILRNYFTKNNERNIRANYPTGEFDFEFTNNIVYGFKSGTKPSMGCRFSAINNIYKLASGYVPYDDAVVDSSSSGGGNTSETYAYIIGNIKPSSLKTNDEALQPYLKSSPFLSSGFEPIPSSELEIILDDVGCSLPKRDAKDQELVNDYK